MLQSLRRIIHKVLMDARDYYAAAKVLERVRSGKERVIPLSEVERDLDQAN